MYMDKRPNLDITLDSKVFKEYYYLKQELITFCQKYNLQTSGSKIELTARISNFLETGQKTSRTLSHTKTITPSTITLDTPIEENFICSEKHRAFYQKEIGSAFTFNVLFQQWLKNNAGKTYKDSISAYYEIIKNKENNKTEIAKQFEYNTYIRAFFSANKGKNLNQAIKCWKYKKSLKGHNNYEQSDLKALEKDLTKM